MEALPNQARSRPTMQDVADTAGVGLATVSRVLNGQAHVAPQTVERVRAAVDRLGFQRDEMARALGSGQRSSSIAILLGDLSNPFYGSIANGAVRTAQAANYALVVGTVDEDPAAERRVVEELIGRRIAGLIIVPDQGDHSFLRDEIAPGTPVVFADRPAEGFPADAVVADNVGGGKLAAEHLLAQGHRRIAILVAPSYYTTGLRLRGFRGAARRAGLSSDDVLVRRLVRGTAMDAELATNALLAMDDPPTAIFATTNFLSEGAIRAMHNRRRYLDVVGFDDFPWADLLEHPITVVAGDAVEMGRTATRLLLDRIAGNSARPRRITAPVTLTTRGRAASLHSG